jgi:HSP20 family protein
MITTRNPAFQFASTLDRMGTLSRVLDQAVADVGRGMAPTWVPALEVAERANSYLIACDLPGVREDQVELTFENNVLTLRGTRAPSFTAADEGGLRVHLSERQTGAFERAVRLPEYVEGDRIEASFADGVLRVIVPKSSAAQPRRIQIGGAGGRVLGTEHGARGENGAASGA